jgi:hypothetical protein
LTLDHRASHDGPMQRKDIRLIADLAIDLARCASACCPS